MNKFFTFIHSTSVYMRVFAALFFGVAIWWGITFSELPILSLPISGFMLACGALFWFYSPQAKPKKLPDPENWIGPNTIKLHHRLFNVLSSIFLITYSGYAFVNDAFYMPGKNDPGGYLHGFPVLLMGLACFCVVVHLASAVVDHYDKRNNELFYAHASTIALWLAWGFFLSAQIFRFQTSCNNTVLNRMEIPEKSLSVITFDRSCSNKYFSRNLKTNQTPNVLIKVVEKNSTISFESKSDYLSVISLGDNNQIDGLLWSEGKILLMYHQRENKSTAKQHQDPPSVRNKFPLPVLLVNLKDKERGLLYEPIN